MKHARAFQARNRRGSTLVLSLICITMFSALIAAVAAFSGTNVQLSDNLRKADMARACAESGLEVVRYWLNQVEMSGKIADSQRFSTLAATLQSKLTSAGIMNITSRLTCTASTITMADVPLNTNRGQHFSAVLTKIDDSNIRLDVTGVYRSLPRKIQCSYQYVPRADTAFNFGVATKGPLSLSGNIEMEGSNIAIESNAYIECDPLLALQIIGNSMIYGDVSVTNPLGYIYLQGGQAGVGGVTGTAAMQHVQIGVPPVDFPEMDPNQFYGYATNILSPAGNVGADGTCDNLRIPANRNPIFAGGTILRGVVYIEAPNVVTFGGSVDVTAIIVTDGDPADNSGTNQIKFNSTITGHPVSQLPLVPKFADLQQKTGTFVLAPGFKLTLGGGFTTLCGAIAANGIELSGGAGGTINGSLINYSPTPMTLGGHNDLFFNRSGLTEIPAGFVPRIVMLYDSSSYAEPSR